MDTVRCRLLYRFLVVLPLPSLVGGSYAMEKRARFGYILKVAALSKALRSGFWEVHRGQDR